MQMIVRRLDLVLDHYASKVQKRTRRCTMLGSLLVIMWNARFFPLWRMDLWRRLCVVDQGRLRLVACARSEKIMGSVDLAEDGVVIGVVLLLLRLGIGSEARGFLKVDGVVVVARGHHIKDTTGATYEYYQGSSHRGD